MKSVWFVEQGSYSDYRVVGVFSTREKADFVAKTINDREHYGDASVDERPLDPFVKELNAGLRMYTVIMSEDGTVERCEYDEERIEESSVRLWDRKSAPFYKGKRGVVNAVTASVWARDDVHAIKIVNERRTQMIANGEL